MLIGPAQALPVDALGLLLAGHTRGMRWLDKAAGALFIPFGACLVQGARPMP